MERDSGKLAATMRTRRAHRDAVKCAIPSCPVVTDDLRHGMCFSCYQRQRRHGVLSTSAPAMCVGFNGNECRVCDPRLLRPCGNGLRCLNCSMLARLAMRAGIITAA